MGVCKPRRYHPVERELLLQAKVGINLWVFQLLSSRHLVSLSTSIPPTVVLSLFGL
jgi:hypothetical protein